MNNVTNPDTDGVSAVLDQTTHEVHLYDGGELAFSLDFAEATDLAIQLMAMRTRGWQPLIELPCPTWCTTDHAKFAASEDDLRSHTRTIGEVLAYGGGPDRKVFVDVTVCDNLGDGTRGVPEIQLWGSGHGDGLTSEGARQLADVLVRAADFFDGHWSAS